MAGKQVLRGDSVGSVRSKGTLSVSLLVGLLVVGAPCSAAETPAGSTDLMGPGSDDECFRDEDCKEDGLCHSYDGECVATSWSCRLSDACEEAGRCEAHGGECVATSVAYCEESVWCRQEGKCDFDPEKRRCDEGRRNSKPWMVLGIVLVAIGGGAATIGIPSFLAAMYEDAPGYVSRSMAAMAVTGLVMVGGGIPITVYGGRVVPRTPEPSEGAVTLHVGPGHVNFRWKF